jgi:type IV pilus assembly protein PilQ
MSRAAIAVMFAALAANTAHGGNLCAPGVKHHGKVLDLDLAQADLHDVLRLLADTANINLVVGDKVTGKVTLRMKHVAWDAAACTIASTHQLRLTLDDGILLVTPK